MILLLSLLLAQEAPAEAFRRIEAALASAGSVSVRFEGSGENAVGGATSRFSSSGTMILSGANRVRLQMTVTAAGQTIESLLLCDGKRLWFKSGEAKPQILPLPRLLRANLAGLLLRLDLGSALLMGLGDVDLVKLLPAADWATGPEGELSYRVKVPDLEATIANRLWLDPKSRLPARHDVSLKNADASNTASESFRDFTLGAELPEAQFALPSDVAAVQEEKPAVPPGQLQAGGDAAKTYYVHGPAPGEPPKDGYRLVVVLPGGDGSPAFHPFVKRIQENALGEGCLVVQLIAKEWTPGQFNRVVWPTAKSKVDGMKFTTEEFVDAVIAEISGKHKVDPRRVYTLSWSSGGPAAYAVSLAPSTRVKGSFIAMSVFHAATLPPLAAAKGRAYYLLHSPDDKVCPMALAEKAIAALRENGASAELTTYPGGHGWRGAIFDQIRAGFEWLGNH